MGKKIEYRVMTIEGREVVVLEPADFARLDAYRRQVGAKTAHLSRLRHQLAATNARLAEVEAQLTEAAPDARPGGAPRP